MLIFCAVWFWTGRMPPSIVEATRSAHPLKDTESAEATKKSNPKAIYDKFRVSKKQYKQALGKLYKKKLINITREKIDLV